jgi:hypothetical protein
MIAFGTLTVYDPASLLGLHTDLLNLILRHFNETTLAYLAPVCRRLYWIVHQQRNDLLQQESDLSQIICQDNIYRFLKEHYAFPQLCASLRRVISCGAVRHFKYYLAKTHPFTRQQTEEVILLLIQNDPNNGYRGLVRVLKNRMLNTAAFPSMVWKAYFGYFRTQTVILTDEFRNNVSNLLYELDRYYHIPLALLEDNLMMLLHVIKSEILEIILKRTEALRRNRYRYMPDEEREVKEMMLRDHLLKNRAYDDCEPGSARWERIARFYAV